MPMQKRRVIYLSDEEWQGVKERADRMDMTMSAYIRSSLVGGHVTPLSAEKELRAIAERFSSRPFTPVPKKGK